jgi:hypothetical protein
MAEQKTGKVDRREFTLAAALAVLSGVAITVSGCGGGGGSSPTEPSGGGGTGGGGTGGTSGKTGTISNNHGHTATITSAQLSAAGALALDIRGTSEHPHTVELTAAEIATIAANGRVSKTSSSDAGHTHSVTFN